MDNEKDSKNTATIDSTPPSDFIREAITEDLRAGRFNHVHTRFPPEPNGYLHIGHAKGISINFGVPRILAVCTTYDSTTPTPSKRKPST